MLQIKVKQGSQLWKHFRTLKISSTEMASIFFLNKHRNKNQLWLEKTGLKPRKDFDSQATRHGRYWEPFAIEKFLGHFPSEQWEWLKPGIVTDFREPVCCSPDAMLSHRELDVLLGFEAKCPFSAKIPQRKEGIPPEYLFQCFSCLMITRADGWFLGFYDSDSGREVVFEISPDWGLWSTEILPLVREFLCKVRDSSDPTPPFKRKGKEEKKLASYFKGRLLALTREREDLGCPGTEIKNGSYQE